MSSFSSILRANPGLLVGILLTLAVPFVLGLLALIMRSGGASLRPILFLAGLMLPTALIFLFGSLVKARVPAAEAPEADTPLLFRDGRAVDRARLFGTALDAAYLRDAKTVFPEYFAHAEYAQLGIVGTGETVLASQFASAAEAEQVAAALWTNFGMTGTRGDEQRGWSGERPAFGDHIEMLRTGRHLFFWTGATAKAAAAHRAVTTAGLGLATVHASAVTPLVPALQPVRTFFRPVGMKVAALLLLGVLYTLWFFKGAAWAGSASPIAGTNVLPEQEVVARLLSINALDVPFRIDAGDEPGEFFATWRYADAKWVDLARAHGLRRTFRIRMLIDAGANVVRATDHVAAYDWSAGTNGARIAWQASTGIVFFQQERGRVFGVQVDKEGRFEPQLSYSYRFNLQEMKAPLIDAVTQAGWTWRPVAWQGPTWLRWLTE